MRRALLIPLTALCWGCLEPAENSPYLAERDNDPPDFVRTVPAPGGTFGTDEELLVTFSERMDERSLRPGIFLRQGTQRVTTVITMPGDNGIPDAVQQTDVPYTVSVRGEGLLPNTEYLLVLDPVLIDTAGNQLTGPDGGLSAHVLSYRTNP